MGSPVSQVQSPQTTQQTGKFGPVQQVAQQAQNQANQPQPSGKGGKITFPAQGAQPPMGQPNNYSNTVGPWDNATIGTQNPLQRGKGKGA